MVQQFNVQLITIALREQLDLDLVHLVITAQLELKTLENSLALQENMDKLYSWVLAANVQHVQQDISASQV